MNQMGSTQRIKAMDPGMATGKAKELLDAVVAKIRRRSELFQNDGPFASRISGLSRSFRDT